MSNMLKLILENWYSWYRARRMCPIHFVWDEQLVKNFKSHLIEIKILSHTPLCVQLPYFHPLRWTSLKIVTSLGNSRGIFFWNSSIIFLGILQEFFSQIPQEASSGIFQKKNLPLAISSGFFLAVSAGIPPEICSGIASRISQKAFQ